MKQKVYIQATAPEDDAAAVAAHAVASVASAAKTLANTGVAACTCSTTVAGAATGAVDADISE